MRLRGEGGELICKTRVEKEFGSDEFSVHIVLTLCRSFFSLSRCFLSFKMPMSASVTFILQMIKEVVN